MNKITLFKSLFVALVLSVFSSSLFAEEVISNIFTPTTMQTSISAYDKSWDNVSGTTLTLFGFNNNNKGWEYVRCGSKNYASVATITTKSALSENVTKVVVTIDKATTASINGTYLEVATDAAFTQNVQKTTVTIATGALTYTVATPAENCYYRLTYDCAKGSSNGLIQISKVDFYYESGAVATVEKPVFSVAEGVKEEAFNLEMTCATEGADIYYTLNGGAETKYTSAINIAATTTVKAWAVKGEDKSSEVVATYTFVEYIENATIAQVLAAEVSEYVWYKMTGVIYDLYNTEYGNFYLTNETDTILVYGLTATKKSSNDKSFSTLGLKEGDKITIWGTRSAYNGKVQVGGPAYFVEKVVEEPEPATGVTATWSIEEGDTLESFSAVTVTFAGVDSIGRKLDGTEVTKAYMMISTVATFFSVDAEGKAVPVKADLSEDYDGVLSGTNAGLSTTMKLREDRFTLVEGAYVKKGNYRIVIPVGTVLMQPNRTGLEKVYNDTEFVLNFVIDNDYVENTTPEEVDSYFSVNPENESKVAEIRNIVIAFDDVTALTLADLGETPNPTTWPFCNKLAEDEDFGAQSSPIAPMACKVEGNTLTLSVMANDYTDSLDYISALGNYSITIPAGVVFFAENQINKAITLNYTVAEILPDTVRFANIAAIYEKGLWEESRYADYTWYETIAILESQPTVVDKVVTSGMMGGGYNNYYLNDGTGVIVLQAEGDRAEPIVDDNWNVIGYDTIYGLNIEIGKKLPAEFYATIDFKAVIDDETYLPTGEVYGAPVMAFMSKVIGTEVDEWGWESNITEPYDAFVARCENSDFVEAVVLADFADVFANRIKYAGQLLKVDTTINYYAATEMNYMTGSESTTAYAYYGDVESAFDVESYEDGDVTYVYVSPKMTEDYYNYAGQVFNIMGENLPVAAFEDNKLMSLASVRFDWNSVTMGQSIILKEGWEVKDDTGVDVENNELVANVYSNNGAIYVEAEAGAMIEVYTVNGIRVFAGVSNTNTTIINGLNNTVIIRVNGETYKVMVK